MTPDINGRGKAMMVSAPVMFGVCEALFHAHPLVGGALAVLTGAIAYRHYDDAEVAVERLKEGSLVDYAPKQPQSKATRPSSKPVESKTGTIVIGTDKQGKERGRILHDLKNMLILGLPGQGKSSLACYLLSQMIDQGARIIIIDRHARSDESLSAMLSPFERFFLLPPAYTFDDIEAAVDLAENLINQRMDGTLDVEHPVILVVDEFTDLMKKVTRRDAVGNIVQRLADVVESYNGMGRKYGCFSLCIGQLSNASRTGGTEIRSLFATKMLLGMEKSQADMIVPKEIAVRVERLDVGECIVKWEGKEEPFKVQFPKKSRKYYQDIAHALPKGLPGSTSKQKASFQAQNQENVAEVEVEVESNFLGSETTATLRTIAKRVKSGEKLADIRRDYGLPESGRAMQETNEALRWLGENIDEVEE